MEKEFIFEYTIDDSDIGFDNFNIFAFRLHIHRNNFESKYIEIITSVYEYIEKIKKEGITKELYDNMRAIKNFKFNSQENTKESKRKKSLRFSLSFGDDDDDEEEEDENDNDNSSISKIESKRVSIYDIDEEIKELKEIKNESYIRIFSTNL